MSEKQQRGPYFLKREFIDRYESLLALSDNDDPNIREITRLTESAPSLKRRILEAVNAASNGLTFRVDSTEQAVSLLGARRINKLVRQILIEGGHTTPLGRVGDAGAERASHDGF